MEGKCSGCSFFIAPSVPERLCFPPVLICKLQSVPTLIFFEFWLNASWTLYNIESHWPYNLIRLSSIKFFIHYIVIYMLTCLDSDSGTFLGLGTVTGSVAIYIAFSLQVKTVWIHI